MGSPYVNEGAFDRLKAKGAQAMGALGATMGHQIQNPAETKLRSLWEGFMSSLKKVMKDWSEVSKNQLGPDVKIPTGGKPIKNALDKLAQIITVQIQPINNFNQNYNVYSPRTPRDNPDTYGKPSDAAKLKTIAEAGMLDMFKRDMGLNAALASNNPSKILNGYKNHVLGLFKKFMADAVKSTGLQPKQIYSILAKMQPKKTGWQAAGNMQRVVQQLQKLQGTTQKQPTSYGGPVPPVLSPSGTTTAATPSAQPFAATASPSVPPTTPTPASTPAPTASGTPVSASPTTSTMSAQGAGGTGGPNVGHTDGFDIPPEDLPYVILKALSIIIDAVSYDKAHAMGLFGVHPNTKQAIPIPSLSTKWGSGPHVTASLQENEDEDGDETSSEPEKKNGNEEYYKEFDKQFLYNFQSRYNKYPGQPFTMEIEPQTISPEIEQIPGASAEVWWYNEGSKNKIYASEIKQGKKSNPQMIMNFHDHEVNPKAGATTPGDINQFSIEKVVKATSPYTPSKLESAPSEVKAEIKKMEDKVLRALLATVQRKNMEFVSKGKAKKKEDMKAANDAETANISNDGSVTYIDSESGQTFTYTQDELKGILKGPLEPARIMRKMLELKGYFEEYEMPVVPMETPVWNDAKLKLMANHVGDKESDKLLANAWMEIKEKDPTASIWPEDATVTPDELVNVCLSAKKSKPKTKAEKLDAEIASNPKISKNSEAADAVKGLVALGHNSNDAIAWVIKALEDLGPDKTNDQYTYYVLSGFKHTESPPEAQVKAKTPTAKPTENPPKNPVSTTASAPASSTVSSPVSDAGKEKAAGTPPAKKNPVSSSPSAPVSNGGSDPENAPDKGSGANVKWDGETLEWSYPDGSKPSISIKGADFLQKLKSNPSLLSKLESNPKLQAAFKAKIEPATPKTKTSNSKKPKKIDEFINPFRKENFLY